MQPASDYAHEILRKLPEDGPLYPSLFFLLNFGVFAGLAIKIYGNILGLQLGIIRVVFIEKPKKLSRDQPRNRHWIMNRKKSKRFGRLKLLLLTALINKSKAKAMATTSKVDDEPPNSTPPVMPVQIHANLKDREGPSATTFDADVVIFDVNNSATGHVCNDKALFNGTLRDDPNAVIITVKGNIQFQVGKVLQRWQDDDKTTHAYIPQNFSYAPTSTVNILSVRELSKYFVDDNGNFDETGMTMKTGYTKSTFVWDFNRYTQTFHNSDKGLAEITVNEGNSSFKHYINMIGNYVTDTVEANFSLKKK